MYYIELSEVISLINAKSAQFNVVYSQCECPSINAELTIPVLCSLFLKTSSFGVSPCSIPLFQNFPLWQYLLNFTSSSW